MLFFNLPPELRWSIMCYLSGKCYRILYDNFDECKELDSTLGYYYNYYGEYLSRSREFLSQSDIESLIFHLKDKIRFFPMFFWCITYDKNKKGFYEALEKHCPYLVKKVGGTMIIRTDELDMDYLDRLCLEDETKVIGADEYEHDVASGTLRDSLYKLMPTLEDEMRDLHGNVEIMRMIENPRQQNKERCEKVLEAYSHMTLRDFTVFYTLGSFYYAVICGLAFRYTGERYEELIEFLLNFENETVKFTQDRINSIRDSMRGGNQEYFFGRLRPYFNSRLNVFIPLANVPDFDADAIQTYLESEWLKCANVPLNSVELEHFTPYVSGGALLQALTCPDVTDGWEGSDWDLFLVPNSGVYERYYSVEQFTNKLATIKRNCHEKCLRFNNSIVEFFDKDCELNEEAFKDSEKYKRVDFFDKVFSNSKGRNLQAIVVDSIYFKQPMANWLPQTKIEHVLRLFDVAATQIYWDGNEVYLSAMALYCVRNMVNLCRKDISPYRLEKYTKRGFEPQMLDFDPDMFPDNNHYKGHVPDHEVGGWGRCKWSLSLINR